MWAGIIGCTEQIANSLFSQEAYEALVDEFSNPGLLEMVDKQFELEFPLQHAKLKFHSKVNESRFYFIIILSLSLSLSPFLSFVFIDIF